MWQNYANQRVRRCFLAAAHRMGKIAPILVGLLLWLGTADGLRAKCAPASGPIKYYNDSLTKLTIPATAQVGAVVHRSPSYVVPRANFLSCTQGNIGAWRVGFTSPGSGLGSGYFGWVPGMTGVQWLGHVNSGLGIRWYVNGVLVTRIDVNSYFTAPVPGDGGVIYGPGTGAWGGTINYDIVLVQRHPSRPIEKIISKGSGVHAQSMFDPATPTASTRTHFELNFAPAVITWPKAPTCTTTATTLPIQIGAVSASSLPRVGDRSSAQSNTIRLQCEGSPSVSMVISGNDVAYQPELFGLDNNGNTARGIAVELLHNNQAIKPRQSVSLSTSAGSTLEVPITARYVRIGDIAAGSANARMTAQISYQ